jgi:hypothetical protein
MSDAVTISLIAAVGSFAATLLGVLNNILGHRNGQHIAETAAHMELLEKNTNSIKDALVKVTGEKAYAEGLKAGTDLPRGDESPPPRSVD